MSVQNLYNQNISAVPNSLIVSKWTAPLEGFTPHPKYTTPLICGKIENLNFLIKKAYDKITESDIILAHETTKECADEIMNYGFKIGEEGSCSIRDKAVFGWIHKSDIGHFKDTESDCKEYVVLFSIPESKIFVSSYESSAKQILLGDISMQEYERKHVLSYKNYKKMLCENKSMITHLNYKENSLL